MASIDTSVCRLCRREGTKLFLKGDRCFTDKCAIERRAYAPGQHGQRPRKRSEFGTQLREKQKIKRIYRLRERQFRRTFEMAARKKGITGETLLLFLERRLDNVVARLGFARSHEEGRQLVRHGHITVNARRVTIPSYLVREGDKISVREKSQKNTAVIDAIEGAERRGLTDWLQLDKEKWTGTVANLPRREQLTIPMEEQLVVELYSK